MGVASQTQERDELWTWREDDLMPRWRAWLGAPVGEPPAVRAVGPGVFEVVDLFEEDFLTRMTHEAEAGLRMRRAFAGGRPPNSMHRAGYQLAQRGLGPLVDALGAAAIGPLGRWCYPERSFGQVVSVHGFVAHYGEHGDRGLGFHVDDSDLTLTICLGERFAGSAVYFEGLRCGAHLQTPARPEECFDYTPEPGRALLHLGAHRHGVRQLVSGSRTSVILWARGDGPDAGVAHARAGVCPRWCGLQS